MYERKARLILEDHETECSRRYLHTQPISDVLMDGELYNHRYLIVEDGQGAILGVVELEDILAKVASPDPVERRRWCDMPLESAISARIDSYSQTAIAKRSSANTVQEIRASTISTDDDHLAGLFVDNELYLRWSSIKQILQHALVDTVTGLPNRMVFERRLDEEWKRLERSSSTLCLILIDLDYFKNVNDAYGHDVGDLVLTEIGKTLQRQLRSYDLLVRYGGDEFAAVLTGCSAAQLAIPLERIQAGIRDAKIISEPSLNKFSVSMGAVMVRSQGDVLSQADLFKAADDCLYEAKNAGRACAFVSDLSSSDRSPRHFEEFAASLV